MNQTIGVAALYAAVLVAAGTFLAALSAARFESSRALNAARWGVGLVAGLIASASVCLLIAMVSGDFSLDYVVRFTERALPTGYKVAAFWAGQEGSLLLWALLLAIMSGIVAIRLRGGNTSDDSNAGPSITEQGIVLATLSLVCGFFVVLMVCTANPFEPAASYASDGQGLNPMLQNLGMIAHPPILFVGYAGFTIPFAFMLAAMIAGRADAHWITLSRRWTLVSWLFLSVGILLGAQWAYVELGWGGYWAWDPVENASLLPWLTGTAMLHSFMAQQHRGSFRMWNAVLTALSFILCIFGTYLTRSGVIQSVHAFGASSIGTFFLVFLAIAGLVSVGAMWRRRKYLLAGPGIESTISREGAFLAGNVILLVMTGVTLVGTIFPLISGVMGQPVSAKPSFYNNAVLPLAMLLLAIMALAPMLGSKCTADLGRRMIPPSLAAAVAIVAMIAVHLISPWAIACAAIIAFGAVCFIAELWRACTERAAQHNEHLVVALLRAFDVNHRRYGGQMVHLGMFMLMAGVAGSSLYSTKEIFHLSPGSSVDFAGQTLTLKTLHEVPASNYTAVEAVLTLTDSRGCVSQMTPQRRFYTKTENANAEVAIQSSLGRDLYMNLAGWENDGRDVAIEAICNPLVNWLWLGGVVLAAGTVFCLLPRLMPRSVRAVAASTSEARAVSAAA